MADVEHFTGPLPDYYSKYRRGYRSDLIDHLVREYRLGGDSRVLDLGCGTGQLARPLAAHTGAVIGMDPSPDMLGLAGRTSTAANITWVLGADFDVPALRGLLGDGSTRLVTIGTALHWMTPGTLFPELARLLQPGGGVAIVGNGVPVWTQDTEWGRVLRDLSASWFGSSNLPTCGTSTGEIGAYRTALSAAGFEYVNEMRFDYVDVQTLDEFAGAFLSAAPLDRLDATDRNRFVDALHSGLLEAQPDGQFTETVPVQLLSARLPASTLSE